MKRLLTILRKSLIVLGVALGLLTLCIMAFVNFAPQFGQAPKGEDLKRVSLSPNFKEGIFVNLVETQVGLDNASFSDKVGMFTKFFTRGTKEDPKKPLPVYKEAGDESEDATQAYITWFGHSAMLLEIEGKRILIDPMLGDHASPVGFFAKRYQNEAPVPLDELDSIDAIIISHDHYDHLDYPSIQKLKDKTEHFFTPLGVGSHLKRWGVPADKITELDWWGEVNFKDIQLVATPSRHFSGRGLSDRDKTLWASWVIKGQHNNIYFSGDGGYADHFKEIGEKLGPFDFTMMECGQYNEMWANIHMMPEESVQAHVDVKGKKMMPIHWGAFTLALHHWTEPADRMSKEAERLGVDVVTPMIGQRFSIKGEELPEVAWWK